jgi:hypothetical protein
MIRPADWPLPPPPKNESVAEDWRDAFDLCQRQRDELLAIVREVAALPTFLSPDRDLIMRARVAVAKAEGDQP